MVTKDQRSRGNVHYRQVLQLKLCFPPIVMTPSWSYCSFKEARLVEFEETSLVLLHFLVLQALK